MIIASLMDIIQLSLLCYSLTKIMLVHFSSATLEGGVGEGGGKIEHKQELI